MFGSTYHPSTIAPSIKMSNIGANLGDQLEWGPTAELNQLRQEEKPETTTATTIISNSMDIISSLPDSLLCRILSFLPTRSSVATSILSRRWRHLWKDLRVLDLADGPFYGPQASGDEWEQCFVPFVKAVLAQVRHIHKFRLSSELRDRDAIRSWISSITGPHLQELCLYLWSPDFEGENELPFTCTSLVSRHIYLDDLPSLHLPSLKNLKLDTVSVNLDKFLAGCPALETLEVTFLQLCWSCHDTRAIHMPRSLKSLTFRDRGFNDATQYLEIDTPSLEYLHIKLEDRCLTMLVSNFPNMVEAHLDICPEDVHVGWVPELLKALCRTRLLVLKASTTECLLLAPVLDFPEFGCLLQLQIGFRCFNSRFLVDLLHNCHRLQVLMIHIREKVPSGDQYLKSPEPSGWTQPISVPSCVVSHLSIIEFKGYQDSAEEHEFTAYILQRGLVLKTMTVHTRFCIGFDQEKKDHILKELSIVPRGSSICQLKLD